MARAEIDDDHGVRTAVVGSRVSQESARVVVPSKPDPAELLHHQEWLARLALAVARDEHHAGDLVQETWVRALDQDVGHFRSARAWLRRVLLSRLIDDQRREATRRRREQAVARPDVEGNTAALVERAELRALLVEEVRELPEPYRTTVLLHHFEGQSVAEIAGALDLTPAGVRTRIRRAHELLRGKLRRRLGSSYAVLLMGISDTVSAPPPSAVSWAWIGGVAAALVCGALGVHVLSPPASEPGSGPEEVAVDEVPTLRRTGLEPVVAREPTARPAVGTVTARVVDDRGRGIEGVDICLSQGATELRTESASSGWIELPNVAAEGAWVLSVRPDQPSEQALERVEPKAGETTHLGDLVLVEPGRLVVTVVDQAGSPVPNAVVTVFRPPSDPFARRPEAWTRTPAEGRTDASGRALLSAVSAGRVRVRVRTADGVETLGETVVVVSGREVRAAVEVSAVRPLDGTVRGAERVPALDVVLSPLEVTTPYAEPDPSHPLARVIPVVDGRYRVDDLTPQPWMVGLRARDAEVDDPVTPFGIVDVRATAQFNLQVTGGTVTGEVRWAESHLPVDGARIRVRVAADDIHGRRAFDTVTRTGADGRFHVHTLRDGRLRGATPGRHAGRGGTVAVVEGAIVEVVSGPGPYESRPLRRGAEEHLVFEARSGREVHGRLVHEGLAVPGGIVSAAVLRGEVRVWARRVSADRDGEFSLSGLPLGRLHLRATAGGGRLVGEREWPGVATSDGALGDVELRPTGRRALAVVGPTGVTPAGAEVRWSEHDGGVLVAHVSAPGHRPRTILPEELPADGVVALVSAPRAHGWVDLRRGVDPTSVRAQVEFRVEGRVTAVERVTVSPDGRFEFGVRVPASEQDASYRLSLRAPGRRTEVRERSAHAAATQYEFGTVSLEPLQAARVLVLAHEDGTPLEGATVARVLRWDDDRSWPVATERVVRLGRTDRAGRAPVHDVDSAGSLVEIAAPGRLSERCAIDAAGGDHVVLLRAARSIEGRVLRVGGAGVAWVRVLAWAVGEVDRPTATVITDGGGAFRLAGLVDGSYRLEVRSTSSDAVPLVATQVEGVDAGARDVVIEVPEGAASIRGVCVGLDGRPVPGAAVLAKLEGGGGNQGVRAASDGRFELSGLHDGSYTLFAHTEGLETGSRVLCGELRRISTGAADVRVVLDTAAELRGTLELGGVAIAGKVTVVAVPGDGGAWEVSAAADDAGAFLLRPLLPLHHRLELRRGGPRGRAISLLSGGEARPSTGEARLRLDPERVTAGRVLSLRRRAVGGAEVAVVDASGRVLDRVEAAADGSFLLIHEAGSHRIVASSAEFGRAALPRPGPSVEVALHPGPELSFRLLDASGRPVPGCRLLLRDPDGGDTHAVVTDAAGRVRTRAAPCSIPEVHLPREAAGESSTLRLGAADSGEIRLPAGTDPR